MRAFSLFGAVLLLTSGCAAAEVRPPSEDAARLLAPLPACMMPLPSRRGAGVAVSLREEQYWKLVYPEFDAKDRGLPSEARACTGAAVGSDPALSGGEPLHARVEEGDAVVAGGTDRLRVVWLRSRKFGDGTSGGALALVRGGESSAEVYAVGAFRGRPTRSRFSLERVGSEVVVVAQDDGCGGRAPGAACETLWTVFLPRQGQLRRVAGAAIERVTYQNDSEPGIRGRVEYRLSCAPQFVSTGVKLQEQVVVRDAQGRVIREAELDRSYALMPDATMVVSDESLWARLVPASTTGL